MTNLPAQARFIDIPLLELQRIGASRGIIPHRVVHLCEHHDALAGSADLFKRIAQDDLALARRVDVGRAALSAVRDEARKDLLKGVDAILVGVSDVLDTFLFVEDPSLPAAISAVVCPGRARDIVKPGKTHLGSP